MSTATARRRVRRAAERRASAQVEFRDAILAARVAGLTVREIGALAGLSHARIVQIVTRGD